MRILEEKRQTYWAADNGEGEVGCRKSIREDELGTVSPEFPHPLIWVEKGCRIHV